MKTQGNLNVWFVDRNYGFVHIKKDGVILKYFLHATNVIAGTPRTGAVVLFDGMDGSKGLLAVNAEIVEGSATPKAGA